MKKMKTLIAMLALTAPLAACTGHDNAPDTAKLKESAPTEAARTTQVPAAETKPALPAVTDTCSAESTQPCANPTPAPSSH